MSAHVERALYTLAELMWHAGCAEAVVAHGGLTLLIKLAKSIGGRAREMVILILTATLTLSTLAH